jgi:hypothetical protein
VWNKHVVTLLGRWHIFQQGYSCPDPACLQSQAVYTSSEANRLTLRGRGFGRDVIIQAGYWRFWDHATVDEILERFQRRKILLSRRTVLHLLGDFLALLRAAQPARIAAYRPFFAQHGLIIGLDGMQPEKGNDCLYIVREEQMGVVLLAEILTESSVQALDEQVLAPIAALGFPVRGIVSDAQDEIQRAVAQRFPGVPHHTCHYHCLRDAGSVTFAADRAMKVDLKKALRAKLYRFNRRLKQVLPTDPYGAILTDYVTCVRQVLLLDGVAPFDLGGLRGCDSLRAIEGSLQRCQKKGAIHCCLGYWGWSRYTNLSRLPIRESGDSLVG